MLDQPPWYWDYPGAYATSIIPLQPLTQILSHEMAPLIAVVSSVLSVGLNLSMSSPRSSSYRGCRTVSGEDPGYTSSSIVLSD
jgi:hypothetical protein